MYEIKQKYQIQIRQKYKVFSWQINGRRSVSISYNPVPQGLGNCSPAQANISQWVSWFLNYWDPYYNDGARKSIQYLDSCTLFSLKIILRSRHQDFCLICLLIIPKTAFLSPSQVSGSEWTPNKSPKVLPYFLYHCVCGGDGGLWLQISSHTKYLYEKILNPTLSLSNDNDISSPATGEKCNFVVN